MTPYWHDAFLTVYEGDCRAVMAQMEPESVHCVVTSPPYWGLRDYGIGDKGLGLEPTPEQYVENMVAVFREVRRVLRKDGTCWVNLGDSYGGPAGNNRGDGAGGGKERGEMLFGGIAHSKDGTRSKDLVGIPWRVAFALQADGWYLRSDIIWSKPNPMPESVTDRPTKAHEYLFLLTRSPRYYYDADAVREPSTGRTDVGKMSFRADIGAGGVWRDEERTGDVSARNLRTVWTIATQPYPGAHFATFPEALVEPCVKAGTSERGVCPECGAPWWREVGERPPLIGWRPGCGCMAPFDDPRYFDGSIPDDDHPRSAPVPATVLDPFAGSGTTGRVAQRLGRKAVLIDLSGEYLKQAMTRNADIPLGLETA